MSRASTPTISSQAPQRPPLNSTSSSSSLLRFQHSAASSPTVRGNNSVNPFGVVNYQRPPGSVPLSPLSKEPANLRSSGDVSPLTTKLPPDALDISGVGLDERAPAPDGVLPGAASPSAAFGHIDISPWDTSSVAPSTLPGGASGKREDIVPWLAESTQKPMPTPSPSTSERMDPLASWGTPSRLALRTSASQSTLSANKRPMTPPTNRSISGMTTATVSSTSSAATIAPSGNTPNSQRKSKGVFSFLRKKGSQSKDIPDVAVSLDGSPSTSHFGAQDARKPSAASSASGSRDSRHASESGAALLPRGSADYRSSKTRVSRGPAQFFGQDIGEEAAEPEATSPNGSISGAIMGQRKKRLIVLGKDRAKDDTAGNFSAVRLAPDRNTAKTSRILSSSVGSVKAPQATGHVGVTLDTNFDQIDDIVDSSKMVGGMVGPKDELLPDDGLPVGHPRHGSEDSGKIQYAARRPSTASFNLHPVPIARTSSPSGRRPSTTGSASHTPHPFDPQKAGLKKVSLAEAQRLSREASQKRAGPFASLGNYSLASTSQEQWAPEEVLSDETDPSGGAIEMRKSSAASRGSARSGVSPKSSVVNLQSVGMDASDATAHWSRQGVADPHYEFPRPGTSVPLEIGVRKDSTGSAGAGGASAWMAPDSWAVQPDGPGEDSDSSGNEAAEEKPPVTPQLRKGSSLSSGWSERASQKTGSSSGPSPLTAPDAALDSPTSVDGEIPPLQSTRSSWDASVPANDGGGTHDSAKPSASGSRAVSRSGLSSAGGAAAAAAANVFGLGRTKQKGSSRPNTAAAPVSSSRPSTAATLVDDIDVASLAPHGAGPSSAGALKRPQIATQNSAVGSMMKNHIVRVGTPFGIRTVSIPLWSSAAELRNLVARKAYPTGAGANRLFIYDKGSERPLHDGEKPAMLQRRRMEQAGFTERDGIETVGREDHSYLLRFVYRPDSVPTFDSESFGNTEDNYTHLDLSKHNIEMVPIFLYRHADWINSLDLSANPMSELPTDFIQLCSSLRTLRLSNLAMKRIPQSVRYSETLTHLDVSNNRLPDLHHISLDQIVQLRSLKVQNNRLTDLPPYFANLKQLKQLNVSNNKFDTFPSVICNITSLTDLDISFNAVGVLPANLGNLTQLESLILVGNSIEQLPAEMAALASLRKVDLRRNVLQDVSTLFKLNSLSEAQCEHNSIKALDASLGSSLRSINLGHNPLSKLTLGTRARPQLTHLDLSHANIAKLDEALVSQLLGLTELILDSNQFVSLPESLGDLTLLRRLSLTDNHLSSLPDSIGKLTKLQELSVYNNNLKSLPNSIWHCASLTSINASSNLLESLPMPPAVSSTEQKASDPKTSPAMQRATSSAGVDFNARRGSEASISVTSPATDRKSQGPPLATSLKTLRLADNRLTLDVFDHLGLFTHLEILNLSFNEIYEIPPGTLRAMISLTALYLSGNNLSSLPTEDLLRLTKLRILHINANRLQVLPAELGQLTKLANFDVGNNNLKYNISNWQYDWNYNSNPDLRYLNLSGNKRLEIKSKIAMTAVSGGRSDTNDFQRLINLRVLGLMDVTVLLQQMPDEHENRRVRTSLSQVNNMAYGISDALGRFDNLSLVDVVVPHWREDSKQCIIGLFEGRGHGAFVGSRIAKHLADAVSHRMDKEIAEVLKKDERPDASVYDVLPQMPDILRRAFLYLQQEYALLLLAEGTRRPSGGRGGQHHDETKAVHGAPSNRAHWQAGASGVILYLVDQTLFVANAGDALAVLSRGGTADHITTRHDPFDRAETERIRSAEGWVSLRGYVNDTLDVSRSFGYYHLMPFVNAAPAVRSVELNDSDEFVIVASKALWSHMSYQTAVDIARTERDDLMIAAQKLRDFAISYGAEESIMVMVISIADLFENRRLFGSQSFDPTSEAFRKVNRRDRAGDRTLARLEREVAPPIGHVALVFTDIKNSTSLWETNGGMQAAIRLHNILLRRQLRVVGGYEVKTEGDAFMASFPSVTSALLWCFNAQLGLLKEDWPQEILESEDGKEVMDSDGNVIYRGLSVRMGIHWGWPVCEADPITRRMDYFGPMVNRAARISAAADGGQIMASRDVVNELTALIGSFEETSALPAALLGSGSPLDEEGQVDLRSNDTRDVVLLRRMGFGISEVGERRLKGLETPEILSLVYPKSLATRIPSRETDGEAPAAAQVFEPTPSLLNIDEVRALGMVCLRLEALSNDQLFPGILADTSSNAANGNGINGFSDVPTGPNGTPVSNGPGAFITASDTASIASASTTTPTTALAQMNFTPTAPTSLIPHGHPTSLYTLHPPSSRLRSVEKYLSLKPELLILSIRDDATDDELATLLEQLMVRILNALVVILVRKQVLGGFGPGAAAAVANQQQQYHQGGGGAGAGAGAGPGGQGGPLALVGAVLGATGQGQPPSQGGGLASILASLLTISGPMGAGGE